MLSTIDLLTTFLIGMLRPDVIIVFSVDRQVSTQQNYFHKHWYCSWDLIHEMIHSQ